MHKKWFVMHVYFRGIFKPKKYMTSFQQCCQMFLGENPHSASKYPHFWSPPEFFKNPHIFSKKSPLIWHTILKNDPPDFFIAFLCNNFLGEIWHFGKFFLEMDFFFQKKFKLLKTMESKLAWIRKWLTLLHFYVPNLHKFMNFPLILSNPHLKSKSPHF